MANARKCDICGRYYDAAEFDLECLDQWKNTSMVRVLRLNPNKRGDPHDVMHFDSCEECLQDVLDYILTRKACSETTVIE